MEEAKDKIICGKLQNIEQFLFYFLKIKLIFDQLPKISACATQEKCNFEIDN